MADNSDYDAEHMAEARRIWDEWTAANLAVEVPLDNRLAEVADGSKGQRVEKTPNERMAEANAEWWNEHSAQAKQRTSWRRFLFWTVAVMVIVIGASATVAGWWYFLTMGDDADPVVLSVWIGSNVVQVVGLLSIITKHLFPAAADEAASPPHSVEAA